MIQQVGAAGGSTYLLTPCTAAVDKLTPISLARLQLYHYKRFAWTCGHHCSPC